MEEKKGKKIIIAIIIIILIALLIAILYPVVYNKYFKKEEKVVTSQKKNDFYEISNLLNKKYIIKLDNETNTSDNMIKIENNKVYVKEDPYKENNYIEVQGYEGTPKYVYAVASGGECSANETYIYTEEGNLYYANYSTENNCKLNDYKKINKEKIINLYVDYAVKTNDNKLYYPQSEEELYAETKNSELKLCINGKIEKTYKEEYSYPDKVSTDTTGYSLADGDGIYIS